MKPIDDYLDSLIMTSFSDEKQGYKRVCPDCKTPLRLDRDGVWACPNCGYRHP